MRIIRYTQKNYHSAIKKLDRRPAPPAGVEAIVKDILADVEARGDRALIELSNRFDGAKFASAKDLRVGEAELAAAEDAVDAETKKAIAASRKNVIAFAKRSLRKDWCGKNAQGAEVGERYLPFERVGIYVPGGSAPLVSTSNMTVCLAAAAGCPEIVVMTPPGRGGEVNPALLYALKEAGATEIYKVGGAQGMAGMSIGTKTIKPVVKVYGPGNSFVVEAKRQLFGVVAVDLLPGPSEVVTLADSSGKAKFIAADMLAQAEHGGDSTMGFVTDCEKLLAAVQAEVKSQIKTLGRQAQLKRAIKEGAWCVLVEKLEDGVSLVNAFAPEHLSLITRREKTILPKITTSGAIFIGNYSPVAVGDFLAGPSHELPTGGAGKSFPGLTVDMFQRRTSIVRLGQESIRKSAAIVEAFARVEGLDAHGRSASIRLE
ncbi:MAG: histidinol dehydrogenase [Verrucomicrobiales bacterium]|nr:histidinol dehydrogenase [Verrucomicrobiales bacterium]|tara:strand:+ start:12210 stop:13499 length:1290 start_codon:yes stop_codon:yes gene_type:complete